jgi:hypothetical protein
VDLDQLTVRQARELAQMFGGMIGVAKNEAPLRPFVPGKAYFIRTVTHYLTGRVVESDPQWIVMEDAAWIADTGRYHAALTTGELDEVEPYPNGRVTVGCGAVIDSCEWLHPLPREQK